MATFNSFEPILERLCRTLRPRCVFEWGPGRSTELILSESDAVIYSVEHDMRYLRKWQERFAKESRVRLAGKSTGMPFGGSQAYVTYPLHLNLGFDLIVVDGRQRCDCMAVAALVLNPEGAVLLHDSERLNYRPAFSFFAAVEESEGTAVLTKPLVRYLSHQQPPATNQAQSPRSGH